MKKLLIGTAFALGLASPAFAGNITVTGYNTPDGQGFNDITTTATGAPDTPYSYYTGPITFTLSDNSQMTVYCVDLDHWLQTGVYQLTQLNTNGEGQAISEFDSNRIGHIASIGAAALAAGGTANLDLAAAAQAAIWDIGYDMDSVTSTTGDSTINNDLTKLLGDVFPNVGYAMAVQPYGQNWWQNGSASQQMVVGFSAPEPSTWAMMLLGFAGLGFAGFRRTSKPRLA